MSQTLCIIEIINSRAIVPTLKKMNTNRYYLSASELQLTIQAQAELGNGRSHNSRIKSQRS